MLIVQRMVGGGRLRRLATGLWAGGVLLLVAVTASGVTPTAWPFVDWPMFSGRGPQTSDRVLPVAELADGGERPLEGEVLPAGYRSDALQAVWGRRDTTGRRLVCDRVLAALREGPGATEREDGGPPVAAVRMEEWTWPLAERAGDEPASLTREVLVRCT